MARRKGGPSLATRALHASNGAMQIRTIELGESLLRSPNGALFRGQRGGEDVLVDYRQAGALGWSPQGPPPALLRVIEHAELPEGPAVVYAGFAGAPLLEAVGSEPLPLARALKIARELTDAIAWVHQHGRLHLDLRPSQVLLDTSDRVALLGASHAARLGREHTDGADQHRPVLALAYLAPEQTGRVSRPSDARTDLYGLGALLYRMLAGRPPLAGKDRLEALHAVVAVEPGPLDAPPAVTRIVQRLLAKDALDRYQTARGLLADLDRCLQLMDGDGLDEFELGQAERGAHLVLPDGLYGRADERAALFAALDRIDEHSSGLVLVAGVEGSGKSALIAELKQQPVQLLEGKLDPSDLGSPYAVVTRALGSALARILSAPEERLDAHRQRIVQGLGTNAGVLVPLLRDLGAILGKTESVPTFDPEAAQLRLRRSLAAMLSCLRQGDERLVLVLDDLQWADQATFALVEALLDDVSGLLIVGAFRTEETDESHPVAALEQSRAPLRIDVGPLPVSAVSEFLETTLRRPADAVADLAAELAQRTAGNPFALRWSLRELHNKGILTPREAGGWRWVQEEVSGLQIADNVAALLAGRLDALSESTRTALQAAAVVGTWLQPDLVATALGRPIEDVLEALGEALEAELVEAQRSDAGRRYRFAHDRVREASLQSLEPDAQRALELALGRALRDSDDGSPFEVVRLLNPVRDQLSGDELGALASTNLLAADRAMDTRALDAAAENLEVAWTLLGYDPWSTAYPEALACRDLQVDVAHQAGRPDELMVWAREIIQNAQRPADAARAYDSLGGTLASKEQISEALDVGYEKLAAMGEKLPRHPNMGHVMLEMARTMFALRGHDKAELLVQEPTTDEAKAAFCRSVSQMGTVVEAPEQYLQMALRAVRITLAHGPSRESGFAYSSFGTILCGPFGKLEEGDRFGQLGLDLVRRFGADDIENRVMINYYAFVAHWTHPWRESIPGLEAARQSALRAGDYTFLPGATMFVTQFRLFTGMPLDQVRASTDLYLQELEADEHNHRRMRAYPAFIDMVTTPSLGEDFFAPFEGLELEADQMTTAILHSLRGIAAVLRGRLDLARAEFDIVRPIGDALFGMPVMPTFKFFDAVATLDAAQSATGSARSKLIKQALAHRKFLAPRAEVAPFNLAHRVALIDAELARAQNRDADAALAYCRAADLARTHGFRNDEALVRRRSAGFHQAAGRAGEAERDLESARAALRDWGALGVLATLPSPPTPDAAEEYADVDVETVVRAGNAIGRELQLDRLLATLTGLLLQNAGAQRVALVVREGNTWTVAALEDASGRSRPGLPLDEAGDLLCLPAARYSLRSGESLRVDDARGAAEYRDDPYVQATDTKSILTLPIVRSGRTEGLIYLENRLLRAAFDASGARVVGLLATQIGVSLENARLFDETEGLKRSFERFVPKQMLNVLGRGGLREVELGHHVEGRMTVLFSDIRSFTALTESMSPSDTFAFINAYLGRMEPIITRHGGFIDKYIGDAIMAVFPGEADDAVHAGRDMLTALKAYNVERKADGRTAIKIGIGVHTGAVMLGTVGGVNRIDGTVIGDTVNLASRVEGQTKTADVAMLVTAATRDALREPAALPLRALGETPVRGRDEPVHLFEVVV